MRVLLVVVSACLLTAAVPCPAAAQNPAPAAQPVDDPDLDPNPSQPDFTLVNLPTTLRLPRFASGFRVTHRFTRPLGEGDFGALAGDLFGIDSGALIGLEYRFGLMRGLQAGLIRTTGDKTIQFFSQYNVLDERRGAPLGLGVLASIEGTNNFRDDYAPALGLVLSREFGDRGAVYVQPTWVHDANIDPTDLTGDNDSVLVGVGARVRVRPTVYVLGEFVPRAGYSPGAHQGAFAIEKRAGGHVFQLNFSNGFANTPGQLARGGTASDDWYLGFNISRKFF